MDRVLLVVALVLVVASAAFAVLAVQYHDAHGELADIRAVGIPANVSTSLADSMALSSVPARTAPGLVLTDQDGRRETLRGFGDDAIVLTFLDPHCTDICPIISQELIDAYRDLPPSVAHHVVFLAVNVNRFHATVGAMRAFSQEQGLDSVPTWHFLTGAPRVLEQVWREYGIYVDAPSPTADVIHTSVVYFIGADGREQYLATPMDDHTAKGVAYLPSGQLADWGTGIALLARDVSS